MPLHHIANYELFYQSAVLAGNSEVTALFKYRTGTLVLVNLQAILVQLY